MTKIYNQFGLELDGLDDLILKNYKESLDSNVRSALISALLRIGL